MKRVLSAALALGLLGSAWLMAEEATGAKKTVRKPAADTRVSQTLEQMQQQLKQQQEKIAQLEQQLQRNRQALLQAQQQLSSGEQKARQQAQAAQQQAAHAQATTNGLTSDVSAIKATMGDVQPATPAK